MSTSTARRWTDLLIESDRRYFTAAAILHRVQGGHLAVMPGLAHVGAGAVVLIDEPAAIVADPPSWRDSALAVCATHGARLLRFYTPATHSLVSSALASIEISSKVELAMAGYAEHLLACNADDGGDWSMREVTTPALWRAKQRLHDRTPERPDGKAVDSTSWVRLERRKVTAGYMSPWLIEKDGEACGAFGLSFTPDMLRFKNMFVVPEQRRRGVAAAALRLIARQALARGIEAVGCFAFPGGNGERLYERVGFATVGRQIEWIAPVTESASYARTQGRNAVG